MPNDIKYLDLDDTTSFTILSRSDLSKNKYISILDKCNQESDWKHRFYQVCTLFLLAFLTEHSDFEIQPRLSMY